MKEAWPFGLASSASASLKGSPCRQIQVFLRLRSCRSTAPAPIAAAVTCAVFLVPDLCSRRSFRSSVTIRGSALSAVRPSFCIGGASVFTTASTWPKAIPELPYPEVVALKWTRPVGSGDLAQCPKGHSNSGIAVAVPWAGEGLCLTAAQGSLRETTRSQGVRPGAA